jgi:hypothetical protein
LGGQKCGGLGLPEDQAVMKLYHRLGRRRIGNEEWDTELTRDLRLRSNVGSLPKEMLHRGYDSRNIAGIGMAS